MGNYGKQLYQYGRYIVVITDKAHNVEEDRSGDGYAVINGDWNITEATTTYLYKAINLAQLFEDTIKDLQKEKTEDHDSWKHGPVHLAS